MTDKLNLADSPTWESLFKGPLGEPENIDLTTFRSSAPTFSITTWDPTKFGLRYLKTMLYRLLIDSPATDFDLYRKIENRHVGNPITVRVNDVDVCLDYFQAVHEIKMVRSCIHDSRPLRVIEIGPGYGRTCHTALSVIPEINEYWLVDLGPSLVLSRRYLASVLDSEQFKRVRFLTVQEFSDSLSETIFDFALNIDSFGDMPAAVVNAYLDFINRRCKRFFCKNPLGKYLDDPAAAMSPSVRAALETGILHKVIDIYDSDALAGCVPDFLAAYMPGVGWQCEAEDTASPWTYYHQAIYRRYD